jgi:hypothetical protein
VDVEHLVLSGRGDQSELACGDVVGMSALDLAGGQDGDGTGGQVEHTGFAVASETQTRSPDHPARSARGRAG